MLRANGTAVTARSRLTVCTLRGIVHVILAKLIMGCSSSGAGVEELADLSPGKFLVVGVVDGLGQELAGLLPATGSADDKQDCEDPDSGQFPGS
jgi:hypothetical protein